MNEVVYLEFMINKSVGKRDKVCVAFIDLRKSKVVREAVWHVEAVWW